jgi:hypothetical protein
MALRSRHSYSYIRKTIALATGALILGFAGSVSANRVTLVATINNQAILLPASWSIFKLGDKAQPEPVVTLPRHSGTVQLPAGQYRALVKHEQKTKETHFRVESGVDKTVTIALD